MKNIMTLLFLGFLILGCNSDEEVEATNENNATYFKYTLKLRGDTNEILRVNEYSIDEQGKVLSEDYTNLSNPQYNYSSTFEYNELGRIHREIKDGEVQFNVVWTNDLAEVYNSQNILISQFNFDGETLTNYNSQTFNYDSNQNVISIENETGIFVEFLNYDLSKTNPFNLIESIGILRMYNKPFFKNIFSTEKVYPFIGDDYTQPLTFYEYSYVFDSENRVYQIEDEKTLIYTQQFEYE